MEEVNIHRIDSDAYILKNKLMHRFDKHYGTRLMENDADDLSFLDIIYSVDSPDPLELYAEIESIAGASMVAFNDHEDSAIASYYRYPFSILRMQKLGNEKMQAMLVQNQCILILEIVLSLDLD